MQVGIYSDIVAVVTIVGINSDLLAAGIYPKVSY